MTVDFSNLTQLRQALEATWPPAATTRLGDWLLRDGQGGGKRVSAATPAGPDALDQIDEAIAEMERQGQTPLFSLTPEEAPIDRALIARGFGKVDPVTVYVCDLGAVFPPIPEDARVSPLWEPLAITREIWAAGRIGAERLAVMDRVTGPKTSLLGRINDRPAAAAFVAADGEIACLHALEVRSAARRQGMARAMMLGAMDWARQAGATHLAIAVTDANDAAIGLYRALGMEACDSYHYRIAMRTGN